MGTNATFTFYVTETTTDNQMSFSLQSLDFLFYFYFTSHNVLSYDEKSIDSQRPLALSSINIDPIR